MFQDQNIFKENEEIQEEGKKKKKKTWKIPREISKFQICFHRFPFYTTYLILAGKNLIWGKTSERKFKKYSENSPPKNCSTKYIFWKKKKSDFFHRFSSHGNNWYWVGKRSDRRKTSRGRGIQIFHR